MTSPSGLTTSVPQSGHFFGHPEGLGPGLVVACRADDLRNHVARPLDDDDVSLADLLSVDVLLVVERRTGDGDATDLDRLEERPRIERTRATDADVDLQQLRLSGHGRPLECARPARPAVEHAEPALLVERVDLDHDPVDLVVELGPALLPASARLCDVLDRLQPLGEGVRREAAIPQPLEHLELPREADAVRVTCPVDPDGERPIGRDRRVLLPHRAGRGVPWDSARASDSCPRGARSARGSRTAAGRPRPAPRRRQAGGRLRMRSGMARIVRRFGVTSSPWTLSPRVAPRTNTPSS